MAKKCITVNKIKSELLLFELRNYANEPVEMNLEVFKDAALDVFDRYQSKAGGWRIEDIDWTVYTSDSDDHIIMNNEILFENSICKCDYNDLETSRFLDSIVKRLNSLATNINVEIRHIVSDEDGIVWILIWATDTNITDNDLPDIGL